MPRESGNQYSLCMLSIGCLGRVDGVMLSVFVEGCCSLQFLVLLVTSNFSFGAIFLVVQIE